jgi:photosystem II stability/assembly factor-like uncharacterized protein
MKKIALFVSMMTMALWGNAQSWTVNTTGVTSILNDVFFLNDTVGWVSTTGKVLKTTDGGNTWIQNSAGISSSVVLNSISFTSINTGWAVGNGGLIYKSNDGGQNWVTQVSGTTNDLYYVCFVNDSTGWAVGAPGNNPTLAVILKTTNGGQSWNNINSFFTGYLSSVQFIDENLGWAVGESGMVMRSNDGGLNWTVTNSQTSTVTTKNILDVHFYSPSKGWAVGADGTVIVSSDSGSTWSIQASGLTTSNLSGVYFISSNEGWAVGNQSPGFGPQILYTNNAGQSWTVQNSNTTANISLKKVYFSSQNKGFAVGTSGRVFKYSPTISTISDVEVTDLNIYPNPANNTAFIEFDSFGIYKLKVVDLSGRIMLVEESISQNYQINMESWSSGIYQISITNEKGQITAKTIVKQ